MDDKENPYYAESYPAKAEKSYGSEEDSLEKKVSQPDHIVNFNAVDVYEEEVDGDEEQEPYYD